jgi:hypothetical protein
MGMPHTGTCIFATLLVLPLARGRRLPVLVPVRVSNFLSRKHDLSWRNSNFCSFNDREYRDAPLELRANKCLCPTTVFVSHFLRSEFPKTDDKLPDSNMIQSKNYMADITTVSPLVEDSRLPTWIFSCLLAMSIPYVTNKEPSVQLDGLF